ncbi:MAG: HDOD domain-containing protein [Deltaproteobacteria bacterium]|nr:HDOD domain-containing protein [Deltaproteobacteria bacterium]
MTRVISVTGGKGGVGKTNICLNLALCLADLGSRVCLFDADLGLANINVLLGLYPEYDLEDVIDQQQPLQDIVIKNYHGIDIIPGSSGTEKIANLDQVSIGRLINAFTELEAYDFFFFDTSAGISKNVVSFCLAATEIVVVITPEPTSLTDAYALLKVLSFNGFSGTAKIVVNQCKNTTTASHTYNKFKDVVQKYLSIDIVPLGIIVQDRRVVDAVKKQQPLQVLFPQSSAAKCIQVMASRLRENVPEDFKLSGIKSFWTKFAALTKTSLNLNGKEVTAPVEPAQDQPQPVAPENSQDVPGPPIPDEDAAETETAPADRLPSRETESPRDVLEMSRDLPTLPHILLKLLNICSKDDVGINDLAQIIRQDPSLCSKMLRLVNSAFYGMPQRITNFDQALALLGMDTIKNVAISASVFQVFYGRQQIESFDLKLFWWHSLNCAVIAELISRKIDFPHPEEAFLAGLLHDIGKLVLLDNYPGQYPAVLAETWRGKPLCDAEQKQLGLSHADTGFWLINRWQLQSFIADAVLYHHEPSERIEHALPLVKIIHAANGLCADQPGAKADKEISGQILGINADDVESILTEAQERVSQIAQSLGIDLAAAQETGADSGADRQVQDGLTSQVRDMAMMQGTFQNLLDAGDSQAVIRVLHQGLTVTFDMSGVLFFLYSEEENALQGTDVNHTLTRELTIPFGKGRSLVAAALKNKRVYHSFDAEQDAAREIVDEQLIRLLGTEGIVCFPMLARGQFVGTIVLGIEQGRLSQVMGQMETLQRFVSYAALALHTEQLRETQARHVLSERMEVAGSIAKKVAHEVNNPLSIIKNYLKILELNLQDNNMPADEITVINEEIERASHIIEQLSDFSKPQTFAREQVDVNGLLEDQIKITAEALLRKSIQFDFIPDRQLPKVRSNKNGLKQVFMNLIKNASEALGGGGTISIATKFQTDKNIAEITIRDNGPGLSDIVKSRLFEPYISTKGRGHTGLGLSVVYTTIKELGGTVGCTTEKDSGTCFTILLPIHD